MKDLDGITEIMKASLLSKSQGNGFQTWGNVEVLRIAHRHGKNAFVVTPILQENYHLKPEDLLLSPSSEQLFKTIFETRKQVNCIIITRHLNASLLNEEVPAILDDQAQLLGVSIRVADESSNVVWALKSRFAAILPNRKGICIGSSYEDAYTAAQLLEKTAKVFRESKKIGGAKPINKLEAWFMQQYYLFKYSKEANRNL